MATNKGNRATDSKINSSPVEQAEVGQCENCTCYISHTPDTDNKTCVNCGCDSYSPVSDADLFERIKGLRLTELSTPVVFFGRASRECTGCGLIKLYKEFAEPDNPDILCIYCIDDAVEELAEDYQEQEEEESFTCNYCNEVHEPSFCPEVYADQQYMDEWEESYD